MPGLRARLDRLAYERCEPLYATLELTLRCNLRCTHCYNFDRDEPAAKHRTGSELSTQTWLQVIDALADAGCLYLSLSGGEALLYDDLDELVARAQQRHLRITIKTNGTLLDEARTRALTQAGVAAFHVSLYGATAKTHDALTLKGGSFAASVAGLAAVRAAGALSQITYVVTRHNVTEVEAAKSLAASLDASIGFETNITARYDGTDSSLNARADASQLEALYAGPLAKVRRAPNFDPARSVQCGCARSVCGIAANGDVYPCIGAPLLAGNLGAASFESIWRDSPVFERIRNLRLADFSTCAPCADRPFCRRSSGAVFATTGNYTGPEAFTCMEAAVLRRVHESAPSAGVEPPAGQPCDR